MESAYEEGYCHFLCGMAQGCDLYFCEIVLDLRAKHPEVTLEAAVPCPTQADDWPEAEHQRYQALLAACDYETLVSARYTPDCMRRRNRYLVDHAALLIAAYDGTLGGTQYTVQYAMRRGVEIVDLPILLPEEARETARKAMRNQPSPERGWAGFSSKIESLIVYPPACRAAPSGCPASPLP